MELSTYYLDVDAEWETDCIVCHKITSLLFRRRYNFNGNELTVYTCQDVECTQWIDCEVLRQIEQHVFPSLDI